MLLENDKYVYYYFSLGQITPRTPLSNIIFIIRLGATAASYHAYQGVAPVPLQALMGWSDLATAQKYIRISGRATADALRQVHHR
jgi:hypothetical protein